jgi:hypothetical protein
MDLRKRHIELVLSSIFQKKNNTNFKRDREHILWSRGS